MRHYENQIQSIPSRKCECCGESPEDNEYVVLTHLRTHRLEYREMRGHTICKTGCYESDFTECGECGVSIPLDEAYSCNCHSDRCYLHKLPHQERLRGCTDHTALALWMQRGRIIDKSKLLQSETK